MRKMQESNDYTKLRKREYADGTVEWTLPWDGPIKTTDISGPTPMFAVLAAFQELQMQERFIRSLYGDETPEIRRTSRQESRKENW